MFLWPRLLLRLLLHDHGKGSKISNTKKERTPLIYSCSSPLKQREVTNFAKGGNLLASLCKIGYFPHIMFGIFLFQNKDFTVWIFRTFTICLHWQHCYLSAKESRTAWLFSVFKWTRIYSSNGLPCSNFGYLFFLFAKFKMFQEFCTFNFSLFLYVVNCCYIRSSKKMERFSAVHNKSIIHLMYH